LSDDPDILIVDEALAVGDALFQQKCYNKFHDFQRAGKTVLLVTHDTQAIVKHCHHALLLEKGRLLISGTPGDVVNHYHELLSTGNIKGHRSLPFQVRQGYKGFNIVHYGTKHYALAEHLGPFDLTQTNEAELDQLQSECKCVIGESLQEVRVLVDRMVLTTTRSFQSSAARPAAQREYDRKLSRSILEEFLDEHPDTDGCSSRAGYNHNEHRFGDRRAEIIDFLVSCGEDHDAVSIVSGERLEVYLKVRFHEVIELPMFGFALKTVDGLVLYGTNTRMQKVAMSPAKRSDIMVYKFSVRMTLPPGDVFVDLGLAEKMPGEDNPIDIRHDVIHLHVHARSSFSGLVNLEAALQEVTKTTVGPLHREWAVGS
jgi:lipopolysaccharide transport system ATP-binding protein